MKMLMFDFRESEKYFFNKKDFKDIDITFIKEPLNENISLSEEQFFDTDVISVFITSDLTASILSRFKNLRVIATRSTGYNHIDITYCKEKNIAVCNVPEYGQKSVAQYTMAMILTLVRNLLPAYLDMQRNVVIHERYEARNLDKMTIGIIGCGSIGSVVAKTANYFGMNVLVCSHPKRDDVEEFAKYVDMNTLLSESDVITMHLPSTPETYHLLSEDEFSKMKDGVYIVNTARGELIDILAMYQAVVSGKVKAAALDVLECEYLSGSHGSLIGDIEEAKDGCLAKALVTQKLLAMDNVIITPHIAYNTNESINTLLEVTFSNILNYVQGGHQNRVC